MPDSKDGEKISSHQAERILDSLVGLAVGLSPNCVPEGVSVAGHIKAVNTALIDACVELNSRANLF